MSALVVTLLRFGFLALLWLLVFFVLVTIRNDVFGTRVRDRVGSRPARKAATPRSPAKPRLHPAPSARSAPAPPTHLVVSKGPLTGTALPLGTHTITVGRSPDSALVLDDGYASSRHAQFYSQDGEWFVEDLNSTNGTFVGNERIHHPVMLRVGIPVVIGKTTMELSR